jgi:protein-S-isoprenylcysteine O-methyltransferase Ste14
MKKFITFLFGILSYVVFLVAFLYAIGFVGNILVPKSIDTGSESNLLQAILINVVLLSIFAIQHTIMARPIFKKWWISIVGPAAERSFFVLLSSLALILMYWKWVPIKSIIWQAENEVIIYIINGIFVLGWLIVFFSTFMINHFHLFGLKQISDNLQNKEISSLKFRKIYLYKYVRHPIMLGFIIAFWATPVMTTGHLLFAIVTTLYIFIAVKYLEEPDLKNAIGTPYEEYQNEVPMIVPFIK